MSLYEMFSKRANASKAGVCMLHNVISVLFSQVPSQMALSDAMDMAYSHGWQAGCI